MKRIIQHTVKLRACELGERSREQLPCDNGVELTSCCEPFLRVRLCRCASACDYQTPVEVHGAVMCYLMEKTD